MGSSEGAQYDPGPGGGAALNRGARGLAQKIKDWTDARIAAAIAGRSGLTSLKINGATIGVRQHLDVQMTGATGEDHPELDLLRAILPTGGGGGGSSSTLLYEVTAVGGETSLRLPASGSLPAGYKGLLLLWQARGASSGSSNVSLQLRLNDDTASHYRHMDFAARSSGSTGAEGNTAGLPSSTRFYAARVTPTTAPAGAAAAGRLWLPQASRSTFWQPILSESFNSYWDGVDTQMVQSYGHWMQAAVITSITVLCLDEPSAEPLEAGSYFAVYSIQ